VAATLPLAVALPLAVPLAVALPLPLALPLAVAAELLAAVVAALPVAVGSPPVAVGRRRRVSRRSTATSARSSTSTTSSSSRTRPTSTCGGARSWRVSGGLGWFFFFLFFPSSVLFPMIRAGHKRNVAKLKETGVLKAEEGKAPFTVQGYRLLCKLSLWNRRDGIFAHAFLTFTWSLINRSVSTSTMVYSHLQWFGDALLVDLPRSKADQGT
jgi:hypothetical protein